MLEQPLVFSSCSNIQLLVHSPFPNASTEATLGILLLTVPHLCDLRDSISHHWSLGRSQFNFLVKQRISNFLRSGKYPKHVPLPTYFPYLQKVLVGRFFLWVRVHYGTLYQSPTRSENPFKQLHMLSVSCFIYQATESFNNHYFILAVIS